LPQLPQETKPAQSQTSQAAANKQLKTAQTLNNVYKQTTHMLDWANEIIGKIEQLKTLINELKMRYQ
jgi:hypothetical protein